MRKNSSVGSEARSGKHKTRELQVFLHLLKNPKGVYRGANDFGLGERRLRNIYEGFLTAGLTESVRGKTDFDRIPSSRLEANEARRKLMRDLSTHLNLSKEPTEWQKAHPRKLKTEKKDKVLYWMDEDERTLCYREILKHLGLEKDDEFSISPLKIDMNRREEREHKALLKRRKLPQEKQAKEEAADLVYGILDTLIFYMAISPDSDVKAANLDHLEANRQAINRVIRMTPDSRHWTHERYMLEKVKELLDDNQRYLEAALRDRQKKNPSSHNSRRIKDTSRKP